MDNQPISTQHDQIALYGLFGDSTATLQGLNDHLSPFSLQQSPPCGSTQAANLPISSPVIVSPMKLGIPNSRQHHGVLLSDLADRSPSAGSASASAICSHVSFDNLRCTYLVEGKGTRFCRRHAKEQSLNSSAGTLKSALTGSPTSTSLAQTIKFITPASAVGSLTNMPQFSDSVHAPLKPLRTVTVGVKSLPPSIKNGLDVPDRAKTGVHNPAGPKSFGRKVGQQITVAARFPPSKVPVKGSVKVSFGQTAAVPQLLTSVLSKSNLNCTTSNPGQHKDCYSSSDMVMSNCVINTSKSSSSQTSNRPQGVRLNVIKQPNPDVTNGSGLPNKYEPIIIKQKSQNVTSQQTIMPGKSKILSSGNSFQAPSGVAPKPLQSLVVDESTLKTLVSVLNSQSDLPPRDQVSLLRSLGITVVQAPTTNNNITLVPSKNQPVPARKVVAEKSQMSSPHSSTSSVSNGLVSSKNSMSPPLIAIPMDQVFHELPKRPAKKQSSKRKQAGDGNGPAKKAKSISLNPNEVQTAALEGHTARPRPKVLVTKCKKSKAAQCNKVKPNASSPANATVYLPSCPKPTLLELPKNAPTALKKYVELLNAEIVCDHDFFELGPVLSDSESDTEVTADTNNKLTKSKLLKKHVAKRKNLKKSKTAFRRKSGGDLNRTPFKDAGVTPALLRHLMGPKASTPERSAHPEKILCDLLQRKRVDTRPLDLDCFDGNDMSISFVCDSKGEPIPPLYEKKLAYTLKTKRLRRYYDRLKSDVKRSDAELGLLFTSFQQDATVTTQLLRSMMENYLKRRIPGGPVTVQKRCQLSTSGGAACSALALPYSSYCKRHVWHCKSQCLYKLDKNMKSTADVEPEPFVKKARKRTKLLPLIKRYKKKKRRKVLPGEGEGDAVSNENVRSSQHSVTKGPAGTSSGPENVSSTWDGTPTKQKIGATSVVGLAKVSPRKESDLEETKPADTSEEVLHLTGQEIMMSGVFDKLPEDLHDFDLFTTDKGAEELGRMLAATSPSSGFDDDDYDSPQNDVDSASDVSYPLVESFGRNADSEPREFNSEATPDVIVYNGQNDGNEAPPSLESFSQSQCVHYTFGAFNLSADKKGSGSDCGDSVKAASYSTEEGVSDPIISAEDLKDIEGVLESLQKDVADVHSPKLPSSPDVDHYTSMLARQLSQEVETESLKKRLGSSHSLNPREGPSNTVDVASATEDAKVSSLSRSFSLPATNNSSNLKTVLTPPPKIQKISPVVKSGAASVSLTSVAKSGGNLCEAALLARTGAITKVTSGGTAMYSARKVTAAIAKPEVVKNAGGGAKVMAKTVKPSVSIQKKGPKSQPKRNTSTAGNVVSETQRKSAKNNARKHVQTMPNVSDVAMLPKSLQQPQKSASQPASTILSSQTVPLTLMQGSNQGGSVIKVIVPPGTVVNGPGSSTTQNMLLIPVNALMRSSLLAGNQNVPIATSTNLGNPALPGHSVKTQLSSLQAGQQFFIVNSSSNSAQPHLTLVQKPTNLANRQQALILNPVNSQAVVTKNLLDAQCPVSVGQKQENTSPKQVLCNIKPNYSLLLNQPKKALPTSISEERRNHPIMTSPSRTKCKVVNVPAAVVNDTATSSTALQAKTQNACFGKFSAQQFNIRNIHKAKSPQVKKPKAKFDPVTKKYITNNAKLSTDVPAVRPAALVQDRTMTESMLKEFNASTWNIQNKVHQINSVLSSLNSGKSNGAELPRGRLQDNRTITKNRFVKTVNISAVSIASQSSATISTATQKNSGNRTTGPSETIVVNSTASVFMGTNLTDAVKISACRRGSDTVSSNSSVACQSSSDCRGNKESSSENKDRAQEKSAEETPVCSGTVHWNQTTTAGPEIVSAMTLPLYVTGSLPVGAWSTELAMNCPISGATFPIVFPAHKLRPNYQVPQRVILRNIGSLGILGSKSTVLGQPSTSAVGGGRKLGAKSVPDAARVAHKGTSVTTVVGTTMSPKLSPISKVSANAPAEMNPVASTATKALSPNTVKNIRVNGTSVSTGVWQLSNDKTDNNLNAFGDAGNCAQPNNCTPSKNDANAVTK